MAQQLPIDDPAITQTVREILAFGLIFVGVLVIGGLLNYLISKLVEVTGLTGTDRLLGGVFGFARGMILVLAVLVFMPGLVPVENALWWSESVLIPQFLAFEDWARQVASDLASWVSGLLN